MPKYKIKFKVNPPEDFTRHADIISSTFRELTTTGISDIEVVYGFGPAGELSFTVSDSHRDVHAEILRIAEDLRTGDARTEFLHSELWLTPTERDELGDRQTLQAYDAPYQHGA
jgi:hypothetical protein